MLVHAFIQQVFIVQALLFALGVQQGTKQSPTLFELSLIERQNKRVNI